MKFSEIGKVNHVINKTLRNMKEITKLEYFRIKLENNLPLLFLRKLLTPEKILVYEKDSSIAATIAYMGNLMGNLFVDPEHQGKGIGTALMVEGENRISKKFNSVRIFSYKNVVELHKKRGYVMRNKSNRMMEKTLR
jgi:GNAT superfamily N-acetyltransferase